MSGNTAPDAVKEAELQEADIASYLHRHPGFFEHHPALLSELRIPHESGGAVSLVERQLDTLRGEVTQYKQQIQHLIQLARDNEQLAQRLHQLTLSLIDAVDFSEVLNCLEDHLHDEFQADAVELKLFSGERLHEEQSAQPADPEAVAFADFFDRGQPVCGPLSPRQLGYLFGAQADELGSAALLPLQSDGILGILAIGSGDSDRFHPNMGTDFLLRLGEVVNRKLRAVSLPGV